MECTKGRNFVDNFNSLARKPPSRANHILYELCDQLDTFDTKGRTESLTETDAKPATDNNHEKELQLLKTNSNNDSNDVLRLECF